MVLRLSVGSKTGHGAGQARSGCPRRTNPMNPAPVCGTTRPHTRTPPQPSPRLQPASSAARTRRVVCRAAPAGPPLQSVPSAAAPAVPRSIHDINHLNLLGFGADLAEDHPGFHDAEYKQRRAWIADIARHHQIGTPIPRIAYTPSEVQVWGAVLRQLRELFPAHACREFNAAFSRIGFREDHIPQLQDLSELLAAENGWRIRPVAGLLHPRDFLAGLAFKYFHSTQYVRHHSKPYYTPEPDVCHELLGHVPMLLCPQFASMVQAIGSASLGASESQIWHLTKVYWYTVEFGVVREGGGIKAFGAGILSSTGELLHMASGRPGLKPLDPFARQPKMSYKDGYQKEYFVLDSFEGGARLLRDYSAALGGGRG